MCQCRLPGHVAAPWRSGPLALRRNQLPDRNRFPVEANRTLGLQRFADEVVAERHEPGDEA